MSHPARSGVERLPDHPTLTHDAIRLVLGVARLGENDLSMFLVASRLTATSLEISPRAAPKN
jgi:hypothetical protein